MEYTIKAFIKAKDETVSDVASKLRLSRPTFDSYIMFYENNIPIPKDTYQKIFDNLFSDSTIPTEIFKSRLDMCEALLLQGKPIDAIDFFSRRADRASKLMNCISENIDYENMDDDLYEFINLLMENYADTLFYQLVQFFLCWYGKRKVSEDNKFQVAYFSKLFHAFNSLNHEEILFQFSDWEMYRKQCEVAYMKEKLEKLKLEQERLRQEEDKIRRELYENTIWKLDF